ncbi:MAG TPA: SDR family oxidoreductase [Actinopolymorphaceae bacterium]|jgi:NAD(P)-dependent dehydrogenase (short-subunit alcohol dehydrogenase family)
MRTKSVLVTGGSRGIGAATARRLATAGWDVALSYRSDADAAADVVRDCRAAGRRAWAFRADLADPSDVEALFTAVDAEVGALDGLVNNAGVVSPGARVDAYTPERIRAVFDLNVTGAFLVAGAAVRRMSTRHGGTGGVIVNVSSRAAVIGGANEYVDYAATKAAIDVLTVGLAAEVAREGIRVVGVRPGLIDTEIHSPWRVERMADLIPVGRPGTADEVAAAIAWLLGDDASYVTGSTLDVGGGR